MKVSISIIALLLTIFSAQSQWTEKVSGTTEELTDVYFIDEITGYVVGSVGTILKSSDSGETWNSLSSGTTERLEGVYFIDASLGYVVGNDIMLRTTDAGLTWSPVVTPVSVSFKDIEFTDALTGFCVGYGGTILKTTDGGTTWVQKDADCSRYLASVQFPSANVGYAVSVGYNSNFIKTTDGGETWENDTIDAALIYGNFETVYFTSETEGLIGSWYIYGLVKTSNGGVDWADVSGGTFPDLYSIDFANANVGFAVGFGFVMTTLDGGDTWTTEVTPGIDQLSAVEAVTATFAIAVGPLGKIVKNTQATNDLDEMDNAINFSVYPNPFENQLAVDVTQEFEVSELTLSDVTGKVVLAQTIENTHSIVDLTALESGMYTLSLTIDGKLSSQMVIKQ